MFKRLVKIKLAEKELNISQLASMIGCSQSNLSQILSGDNMRESSMLQIADALDCDLEIRLVDRSV